MDVPRKLPTLSFGDSDALRVGQPVIAVGNPINVGTSVSTGSVSAVNRNLMRTPFDDYIQTDAAINPGNSGGPLIDCSGKVIGINTALLSNNSTQGSIGLGFALPSNNVKYAAAALQDPKIVPNWIGVQLQDMNTKLAKSFKQPTMSGAIVSGAGNGPTEAKAALAWMRRVMLTPDWRIDNLPRLRDLVDHHALDLRERMLGAEESWVNNPRDAWARNESPSPVGGPSGRYPRRRVNSCSRTSRRPGMRTGR